MRTRPIALTLLVLFATTEAPARAAAPRSVTHEDQRDVMVTIYNGNLGLVKDVRDARFPADEESYHLSSEVRERLLAPRRS